VTNVATILNTDQPAPGSVASLKTQVVERGESNNKRALRRLMHHKMALFGLGLLIFVFLFVAIGSIITTESQANYNDPSRSLEFPSTEHLFGTDDIGRDIFARTVYGGQISIFIAVTAVIVQISLGVLIGLSAGFFGGATDAISMRLTETLLAIPQLFIALIVVRVFSDPERLKSLGISSTFYFFGRQTSVTLFLLVIVIGLTSWMHVARIVRSAVLSISQQEYITAAKSIGVKRWTIVFRHILPNCSGPIIVAATLGVGSAILLEAYLGFLGLGVRAPTATWGNIMNEASAYPQQWNYWLFPALLIMLTSLGINFFGDGLRDALDPRSTK
jgi:peptide/nickel transport system permease protein